MHREVGEPHRQRFALEKVDAEQPLRRGVERAAEVGEVSEVEAKPGAEGDPLTRCALAVERARLPAAERRRQRERQQEARQQQPHTVDRRQRQPQRQPQRDEPCRMAAVAAMLAAQQRPEEERQQHHHQVAQRKPPERESDEARRDRKRERRQPARCGRDTQLARQQPHPGDAEQRNREREQQRRPLEAEPRGFLEGAGQRQVTGRRGAGVEAEIGGRVEQPFHRTRIAQRRNLDEILETVAAGRARRQGPA